MKLRDYQEAAVEETLAELPRHRSVLLVAPTGAGKTVMGTHIVQRVNQPTLWVVHRRELAAQAKKALGARAHDGRVIVKSVQSLARVKGGSVKRCKLIVFDEAHHYVADQWKKAATMCPGAQVVGLTATPERGDGRPLGDMFRHMVVSVTYPELISRGYLVPCKTFRSEQTRQGSQLAKSPVEAYQELTPGELAFCFCRDVAHAEDTRDAFLSAGIEAAVVEGNTSKFDRDSHIRRFSHGHIKVLCNVYTLTEGVDVPAASTCILARTVGHISPYLQMVGRVLRPHPDKTHACLIDLTGASAAHCLPGTDVEYSLGDGVDKRGIRAVNDRYWLCMECGMANEVFHKECSACGHAKPPSREEVKIHSDELREVYAGKATPTWSKLREHKRLMRQNKPYYYVVKEYRRLFGEDPPPAPSDIKHRELEKLIAKARDMDYSPGWVKARYANMFGENPPRSR